MKKYEYVIIDHDNPHFAPQLNKLGNKGWELVSILKTCLDDYSFYLKREIVEQPTKVKNDDDEVAAECIGCGELKWVHELKDDYCRECYWLIEDAYED